MVKEGSRSCEVEVEGCVVGGEASIVIALMLAGEESMKSFARWESKIGAIVSSASAATISFGVDVPKCLRVGRSKIRLHTSRRLHVNSKHQT